VGDWAYQVEQWRQAEGRAADQVRIVIRSPPLPLWRRPPKRVARSWAPAETESLIAQPRRGDGELVSAEATTMNSSQQGQSIRASLWLGEAAWAFLQARITLKAAKKALAAANVQQLAPARGAKLDHCLEFEAKTIEERRARH